MLTLYSVGVAEQFLNHSDDRARGEGNNPFGNFTDVTAVAQATGNGPFPLGDQAIYQFDVYAGRHPEGEGRDIRFRVHLRVQQRWLL